MRVLGIDLGLKRTGLAVSDELGLSVRTLPNRVPKSRQEDIAFLLHTVRELSVSDIVIGAPLLPVSGQEGPMARRFRGFADALDVAVREEKLEVRVHRVDESYSSKRAAARIIASGIKKTKRKAALDSEVARGLVLDFLAGQASS